MIAGLKYLLFLKSSGLESDADGSIEMFRIGKFGNRKCCV